jgi:hypothetical protein
MAAPQTRPVLHELLIIGFVTVTTPVTLMILVRAGPGSVGKRGRRPGVGRLIDCSMPLLGSRDRVRTCRENHTLSSDGRHGEYIDVERTQSLFRHAPQKHLDDSRAPMSSHNQKIRPHLLDDA